MTDDAIHTRGRAVAALAVSTCAFAAAIAFRTHVDPWLSNLGAGALGIVLAGWALGRARVIALLTPRLGGIVYAAALGVALVVATHLAFRLLAPWLGGDVARLYGDIDARVPRIELALIAGVVAFAEELLWRGAALALIATSRVRAGLLAVVLYAIPQVIAGEWILIAAAVGLGTILTIQRQLGGRIIEPLVTHAIWSIAIFVVFPVT